DNLVGEQKEIVGILARSLVETMAMVSPGAKRGNTAPYSYAEFVLLERGGEQPRTLANAFLEPVPLAGANVMRESAMRLMEYRNRLFDMYGLNGGSPRATVSTIHDVPV